MHALYAERASDVSPSALLISAVAGEGVEALFGAINTGLFPARTLRRILLDPAQGRLRSWLHEHCDVRSETYGEGDDPYALEVMMSDREILEFDAMRAEEALIEG